MFVCAIVCICIGNRNSRRFPVAQRIVGIRHEDTDTQHHLAVRISSPKIKPSSVQNENKISQTDGLAWMNGLNETDNIDKENHKH